VLGTNVAAMLAQGNSFKIEIAGNTPVTVVVPPIPAAGTQAAMSGCPTEGRKLRPGVGVAPR